MTGESDRRAAGSFDWVQVVTSIDFDESPEIADSSGKPFKRPAGKSLKGVAFRIGYWCNADGTRAYLGPARIAASCEVDYKTAKLVLRTLCAYKLLTLVQRGGGVTTAERESNGGEYRLTIPHNLAEVAKVRTQEELEAEIEAIKEKNRNKSTGKRSPRESRGADAPVSDAADEGVTGQSVPGEGGSRGNAGGDHGAMASAIPTQYQPVKENQPSSYLPADEPHAPTGSLPKEEGEDSSSEDRSSEHQVIAVELATPYMASMRVTERRRFIGYITAALSRGWPKSGIARELAADHTGLGSLTGGLIARARDLGEPPSEAEAALTPNCGRCNGKGVVWSEMYGTTITCNSCPTKADIIDRQPRTSQRGGFTPTPNRYEPYTNHPDDAYKAWDGNHHWLDQPQPEATR